MTTTTTKLLRTNKKYFNYSPSVIYNNEKKKDDRINVKLSPVTKDIIASTGRVGLSSMDMMNIEEKDGNNKMTTVTGYTKEGFFINGAYIHGSIILLKEISLIWKNVQTVNDINLDSVRLIELLNPKPELFLIGTGINPYLFPDIQTKFEKIGIAVEVMSTKNALSTFNVLCQEDRLVACALLTISENSNPTSNSNDPYNYDRFLKKS